MSSPTTLSNIYERYKKESGDSSITLLQCIQDLNDLLWRMEITKPAEQTSKIYFVDGFEKYSCPAGFRSAIGLYSSVVRIIRYVSLLRYNLKEQLEVFTDQSDNGVRFLLINHPANKSSKITFAACNSLTEEGTWSISGGSSLAVDESDSDNGDSIGFSVSSSQCLVSLARSSVADVSGFTDHMRGRLYAWLPTLPSSIVLRFGSDSANYYYKTITTQASGEPFTSEDKNELEFTEEGATKVGSPDKTAFDWFQIELNFSGSTTDDNFRINKVTLAKPEILDFEWYSNYVGINSSGALIEKIEENEETTDEPIVKNYPDYINTVIDGLCSGWLRARSPERAAIYEASFRGEYSNKTPISGMALLQKRYPNRTAKYKRFKTLPPLYSGINSDEN